MIGKKRLLLIDDDADNLLVCKLFFQRKGYEVMTQLDCDRMMEAIKYFKPDLIFMDHNMPTTCGTQAIQILKSHSRYKHIPIVLFSAVDNIARLAEQARADAYLQKPFVFEKMLDLTNRLMVAFRA
jgi:CheY-like chemotaxis protein